MLAERDHGCRGRSEIRVHMHRKPYSSRWRATDQSYLSPLASPRSPLRFPVLREEGLKSYDLKRSKQLGHIVRRN
jgi:hypothetical protein